MVPSSWNTWTILWSSFPTSMAEPQLPLLVGSVAMWTLSSSSVFAKAQLPLTFKTLMKRLALSDVPPRLEAVQLVASPASEYW